MLKKPSHYQLSLIEWEDQVYHWDINEIPCIVSCQFSDIGSHNQLSNEQKQSISKQTQSVSEQTRPFVRSVL